MKHGPLERLDFTEGDGFEAAGSLEAEGEPADPREQVEDAEHQSACRLMATASRSTSS